LSFEAKLEFPAKRKSGKTNDFIVNMFIFLPYGLDINKHNFTKEDFFESLKTNIRLTTPFYKLEQLKEGNAVPFLQLKKSIEVFTSSSTDKTKMEYEKQIKRFCSIFKAALRYDANKILKNPKEEKRQQQIERFENSIEEIRHQFKGLKQLLSSGKTEKSTINIFEYADEYQSLLIERHAAYLLKPLSKKAKENSPEIKSLNKIVLKEMDYRRQMAYPSVAIKHQDNVNILHRTARLKKFIESNLYLNTDTKKEGVFVEQILFSIAAGIAMVFATGVAFASQIIYGNLSLPFFIALVVGYMFKDRIKELVRVYFSEKHQKVIYDFKTKIYYNNKKKIGNLKESFHFELHSHLPKEVLDARNKMRVTEITEESLGEKIIHYRTKVKIRNKIKNANDFSGVTQILRFNISDFTKKMDDPEKEVLLRTKNGFKRIFSDRVYHINLILTYSDVNGQVIKPYKIYANRKGIRKIVKIRDYSLIKS